MVERIPATEVQDFDRYLKRVRRCELCEDLPLGPKPILQAHPDARILIAGQAPGRRAHDRGVPFDDPSGDRLRQWLAVDRKTFYDPSAFAIVPMGFCYPGTGTSGDLPPRPECAPAWRESLLDRLPRIELTLVIGAFAQGWHLQGGTGGSITETVGRWRDFWPGVVPMPHPSPRNNRWLARNPFFERELVPQLQARVFEILSKR